MPTSCAMSDSKSTIVFNVSAKENKLIYASSAKQSSEHIILNLNFSCHIITIGMRSCS